MFDVVAHLATPLTGGVARTPSLYCAVLNGDVDLFDLTGGEVGGLTQRASDMTKNTLGGIGGGKAVRAAIEGLSLCLQSFADTTHLLSQLGGFLVVGSKVLDLTSQGWVFFLSYCIVDGIGIDSFVDKKEFVTRRERGARLSVGTSMKGARVDCTVATIGRQELGERTSHVVTNEGGDYVFFAIRDDKVVAGVSLSPILNPARSRVDAGLRTCGARGLPFGVSLLGLD